MKSFIVLSWCFALSFPCFAISEEKLEKPLLSPAEQNATYQDIEKTLGRVPSFLRQYPLEGIAGLWSEIKNLELSQETALPAKYKELIAVAVAAQIPCRECVYLHTEAAKLNKASSKEIQEAVAMAAQSRHWSTWLNGMRIDEALFKQDVINIVALAKKNVDVGPKYEMIPPAVVDAPTAYVDIENTLGKVPEFLRAFPEQAIAGAWKNMKAIQMSPTAMIPGKYKELIGLAVSAQIPCSYCTFFHSQFVKLNAGTDAEIKEAVAIASLVRELSTYMTGLQIPESTTRKEADQILRHLRTRLQKQGSIAQRP